MRLLMRFIRAIYGLKNNLIEDPDVIVAIGYGLTVNDDLPNVTRHCLLLADALAEPNDSPIVWASSSYFYEGSAEKEDALKKKYLENISSRADVIIGDGIRNSVDEAYSIKRVLNKKGIFPRRITLVADWPHSRSLRLIWERVFPHSKIGIMSIDACWEGINRAILLRTKTLWLMSCMVRHVALRVFGLDLVRRIRHPTRR